MKILHVTDCFNAGVFTAIEKLIQENPHHEHFLLWSSHSDSPEPSKDRIFSVSKNTLKWNGNLIEKFFQLRKLLRKIQPDLVHYHSSIAGLVGRILNQRLKTWYSPHCFAFQRLDISKSKRRLFFLAERILSIRTGVFVAHWPVEIKLMRELNPRIPISFIPVVNFQDLEPFAQRIQLNLIRIICVGRFRPQKDPEMFIGIAQKMQDCNFEFIWIGSLTEKDCTLLDSLGIRYFQWLNSEQLAQVYRKSWLTLVTSSWESGPLTFFESISHGTPVLARDIEAFEWLSVTKFRSIDEAVEQIREMFANDAIRINLLNQEIQQTNKVFVNYSQIYSSYPPPESQFPGELEN